MLGDEEPSTDILLEILLFRLDRFFGPGSVTTESLLLYCLEAKDELDPVLAEDVRGRRGIGNCGPEPGPNPAAMVLSVPKVDQLGLFLLRTDIGAASRGSSSSSRMVGVSGEERISVSK